MEIMSWNVESRIYIEKLEKVISGIEEINKLNGNKILTLDRLRELEKLKKNAENLLLKLKNGEFEIAIVGLEKAGKSSFANALMERSILPTDDQRCTYTSTCIKACKDDEEDRAEISFYSEKEFATDFQQKLEKLEIPDFSLYTYQNLGFDKYEQLFEKCSDNIHRLYEDTLNQDIKDTLKNVEELKKHIGSSGNTYLGDALQKEEFKEFITKPGKAIAVKEVVLQSSQLKEMPDAIIYDVPGFNSPTAMHREQTLQKMRQVDAIIMVAKADEPSITSDVLSIFKESDVDGAPLHDKLFVFANKADRATDLEKNKSVTYEEWIDKRRILPKDKKERVFFGSANAHLGEQVKNGAEARKILKEKGISDGIEDLRKALKEYYKTSRFEVLKKRIDKILVDIESVFSEVKEEYIVDSDSLGNEDYNLLVLDLMISLQKSVKEKLEKLKSEITNEAKTEKKLTKEISDEISRLVTVDNYSIKQEEIEKIHNEIIGIGQAEQPQRLDSEIRKKKFEIMYKDFNEKVLSIARDEHNEICEKIIGIFMNSMKMQQSSKYYSEIRGEVVNKFDLYIFNSTENKGYYQSLIERFARDLYEILIDRPHGIDRLNKFREEKENYFSMGVYYSVSEAKNAEDLRYIDYTLKSSALWRILLYPEILSVPQNEVLKIFQNVTGFIKENEKINSLLKKLMFREGKNTIEVLEVIFENFITKGSEAEIYGEIIRRFQERFQEIDDEELDSEIISGNRYTNDIANKHSNYSYEMLKIEFDDDIIALQDVLSRAFVRAVNMDKAFCVREIKLIEDIIQKIENKEFERFIAKNVEKIKCAEMNEINSRREQKLVEQAVMKEINRILEKISGRE